MSPKQGDERTKGYTWMQSISGTFGVLAYAIGAVFNNYVLIYAGAVIVLLFSIVPTLFITEPRNSNLKPAVRYPLQVTRPGGKILSSACWLRSGRCGVSSLMTVMPWADAWQVLSRRITTRK